MKIMDAANHLMRPFSWLIIIVLSILSSSSIVFAESQYLTAQDFGLSDYGIDNKYVLIGVIVLAIIIAIWVILGSKKKNGESSGQAAATEPVHRPDASTQPSPSLSPTSSGGTYTNPINYPPPYSGSAGSGTTPIVDPSTTIPPIDHGTDERIEEMLRGLSSKVEEYQRLVNDYERLSREFVKAFERSHKVGSDYFSGGNVSGSNDYFGGADSSFEISEYLAVWRDMKRLETEIDTILESFKRLDGWPGTIHETTLKNLIIAYQDSFIKKLQVQQDSSLRIRNITTGHPGSGYPGSGQSGSGAAGGLSHTSPMHGGGIHG